MPRWVSGSLTAVFLAALGCGSKPAGPVADSASADAAVVAPDGPPSPPAPPYAPGVTSLRLRRSIVVRFEPRPDAKALGTVEEGTRVGWRRATPGPGCPRWIEIEPRGWVCDKYLEPTTRPPGGEPRPRLQPGEIVPGVYGKVVGEGAVATRGRTSRKLAGAVTVRRMAEVTVAGKAYWKTSSGELILASKVTLHTPSPFAGVTLDAERALPVAWAQARKDLAGKVAVRDRPDTKAPIVDRLPARTVVTPLETQGAFVRIGPSGDRFVAATDLHVADVGEPPDDLDGDGKWLDVDLDQQVVVAYQGRRPVYATLVSSGNPRWPTTAGIYRIWLKLDETDMNGQMGDEQPYSVATVPWTMFFARDLAFHTAYWHDRFGEARSHGCLNVSPIDARWLWEWADPDVPVGWSMAGGITERPGSLVKIHSKADPTPEYRGYAKVVHEARLAKRPAPAAVEPEAVAPPADAGQHD